MSWRQTAQVCGKRRWRAERKNAGNRCPLELDDEAAVEFIGLDAFVLLDLVLDSAAPRADGQAEILGDLIFAADVDGIGVGVVSFDVEGRSLFFEPQGRVQDEPGHLLELDPCERKAEPGRVGLVQIDLE